MSRRANHASIQLGDGDEDDERDAREDYFEENENENNEVEFDDDEIDRASMHRQGKLPEKSALLLNNKISDAENQPEKQPPKKPREPRAKLDPTRLCGEMGLPKLVKAFENIEWNGKGCELEDFRLMMRQMENWAHAMFPKYKFDDVLEKVEALGSKREVKTCVKKLMLDMPILPEDFLTKSPEPDPPAKPLHPAFQNPPPPKVFDPHFSYEEMDPFDEWVEYTTVPSKHPAAPLAEKIQADSGSKVDDDVMAALDTIQTSDADVLDVQMAEPETVSMEDALAWLNDD